MEPQDRKGRKGERGYILVMVLGAMAIMGILLTKAMPSVIAEVQRENEEELIFRGEAIALAIKTYNKKTGSYPASLELLTKSNPPLLRKVYKDPMTKDGEWDLVTAVQAGASGDKSQLPIAGVRSRSKQDSFRSYHGKTIYSDWVFSGAEDILGIPGAQSLTQSSEPTLKAP